MNSVSEEKRNLNTAGSKLAKLGTSHGYRFDREVVYLNAMFTVLDPAAHQRAWALQLWACPVAPAVATSIKGHLVTEAVLPPIGEIADDTESFETSVPASTPAGWSDYVMVLVLASGCAGRFDEVHDCAVYARREQFLQPRLAGNAGYRIESGRVTIEAACIENPRDAASLSGTLALELWALRAPYRGGGFGGVPLAGVAFDPLAGQFEYRNRSFDLPFVPPPTGAWNLTLMLREWTAAGYATRDYVNFPASMVVNALPLNTVARTEPAKPVNTAAPAASVRPKEKLPPTSPAKASDKNVVSINRATKEELASIKGLPAKVAEGIVSRRPFKSVDELVKVKGMGPRLLAKLRTKLGI